MKPIKVKKNLPVYVVEINDFDAELGVNFVAHCADPAIGKNFQAFNNDEETKPVIEHKFKSTSDERKIITGALMIPNLPIYRIDEETGQEYYVMFTTDVIEKICMKFMKNNFQHNVNMEHDSSRIVQGVYMFESFITDKERGINAPEQFSDCPNGTWFASYKIDSQEYWDEFIKTGIFKGFSVEGYFNHKLIVDKDQSELEALRTRILALNEIIDIAFERK